MSTPAEEKTRAQTSRENMLLRSGRCLVGTCKCERYEFAGKTDGYDTCECHHTQWGHARP